jgi:hypothetical protein
MLRTRGSAFAREVYQDSDLLTIINLINMAAVTRIPTGYYIYTVRYRFAGMVNPTLPLREKAIESNQ